MKTAGNLMTRGAAAPGGPVEAPSEGLTRDDESRAAAAGEARALLAADPPRRIHDLASRSTLVRGAALVLLLALALAVVVSSVGQLAGFGDRWLHSWGLDLLVASAVIATAWRAGALVLLALLPHDARSEGRVHLELAVGLASLALFGFAIAASGRLSKGALVAALVAVWVASLLRSVWRRAAVTDPRDPAPASSADSCAAGDAPRRGAAAIDAGAGRIDLWLVALPFALFFVWASLPPTFYDAVTYHIALPNLYLNAGGLVWPERFSLAAYPQYAEMLALYPLALGGERAAALTGYLVGFAAALSLRSLIESRCGRWLAALGTLFVLGQWTFWFEAVFTKNDLLAALLLLAAMRLAIDGHERGGRTDAAERGLRFPMTVGLLAGAAVGVKWLAGLPALLLGGVLLARSRSVRTVAVFGLAVLLFASPWLVRNALRHGNPLFPALYSQLGGSGFSEESAREMAAATGIDMARDPASMASRLAGIGWSDGYGSGGELSWLLLPVLFAGLFAARGRGDRQMMLVATLTLTLGVGLASEYVRLYMVSILLAGLAVALVAARLPRRPVRYAFAALVLVTTGQGMLESVRHAETITDGGSSVARGERTPERHLSRMVNHAPLASRMAESVPPHAKVLVIGSARTAYFPVRVEASYAWDEPWVADAWASRKSHDEMTAGLRRDGVTHVVLNAFDLRWLERDLQRFGISRSPQMRAWLDGWLASLELLDHENEVYLFALPAVSGSHRSGRSDRGG